MSLGVDAERAATALANHARLRWFLGLRLRLCLGLRLLGLRLCLGLWHWSPLSVVGLWPRLLGLWLGLYGLWLYGLWLRLRLLWLRERLLSNFVVFLFHKGVVLHRGGREDQTERQRSLEVQRRASVVRETEVQRPEARPGTVQEVPRPALQVIVLDLAVVHPERDAPDTRTQNDPTSTRGGRHQTDD